MQATMMDSIVPATLLKGLQNVVTSGKYSDFIVTCAERSWKVHKVVICAQSGFFQKACEGQFQEAQSGKVELKEDDPVTVHAMLHYFYHFDYAEDDDEGELPMLFHMKLFYLANKYNVKPLQDLAKDKFIKRVKAEWNTDKFADALSLAYQPTSPPCTHELCDIILDVTAQHAWELFVSVPDHTLFQSAAKDAPQFLLEFAQRTAVSDQAAIRLSSAGMDWYRCPGTFCTNYSAVIGLSKHIPNNLHISCPLRCTYNKKKFAWQDYKFTPSPEPEPLSP